MKHEFAIFYADLPVSNVGNIIHIIDTAIVHRMMHVLRLTQGEQCILFTKNYWVRVIIKSITKKVCTVSVVAYQVHRARQRLCVALLPVLKRDSLESAVYQCTAVGVTYIQLVYTQKTRSLHGQKEVERLQKIIIAAAEQSKNFSFPELYAPQILSEILMRYEKPSTKLYADAQGVPIMTVINNVQQKKDDVVFMVGPEGDLVEEEKMQLKKSGFTFCKLTRTILTAEQAVGLFAGIICLASE